MPEFLTRRTIAAEVDPTSRQRRNFIAAAAAWSTGAAFAQTPEPFPNRPLTWVVPYPSGGFGDSMSRLLTQKMSGNLKQPVIVENKPGAGASIGAAMVRQQPADGYTLLYGDIGPFAMNGALYSKPSYDMARDFTPLTRLFTTPLLLVVPAASPLRSVADLVRAGQPGGTGGAGKDGLSYGSYGVGSQPHVWTEMLQRRTSARMTHIPYKGGAPALQDLIAGRLDFMCDVIPSSLPFVRDGRLRVLAVVGSPSRLAALPDVPTMAEAGFPQLNTAGWNGVAVRSGTPPAVIARLHEEVVAALQSPEVASRYTEQGLVVAPLSPAAFADFVRSETARWGSAIREFGITVE